MEQNDNNNEDDLDRDENEDVVETFNQIDKNGDGKLDKTEFVVAVENNLTCSHAEIV